MKKSYEKPTLKVFNVQVEHRVLESSVKVDDPMWYGSEDYIPFS